MKESIKDQEDQPETLKAKAEDETGSRANHGQEPDVMRDEDIPVITIAMVQLREEK
jgi:hypothetical protein